MNKPLILAVTALAGVLGTNAGINSPSACGYLTRACAMYGDANYTGCLDQLSHIDAAALSADALEQADYYRAAAMVHVDKAEAARLLRAFVARYPSSTLIPDALQAWGDCYYGDNYHKAAEIYARIPDNAYNKARQADVVYKLATCYLHTDRLGDADRLFGELRDNPEYGNATEFYQGYIAYTRREYAMAEKIFRSVNTSDAPGNMSDYYLCQIQFLRDDFAKAQKTAKNLLKNNDIAPEFLAEANRIAGMSAYHLGDDAQAIKYLDTYVSMVSAPLPSALYILGISAYNTGDYAKAIDDLRGVTDCNDAMGQAAYLYIGQAYMHRQDYTQAALAFNRALGVDYDPSVQETAYYNYAVASMQGGKVPFGSTVTIFTDFLQKFPDSKYAPAVQEYVISSYLLDNNYSAALKSINEMKNPSKETLAAKQRVLYALGNKALATNHDAEALQYLTEAHKLGACDKAIDCEVALALGEIYYRSGEYAKSIGELTYYLNNAPRDAANRPIANYDMGYSLFAEGRYSEAATYFKKALESKTRLSSAVVADAYNRVGDCYYNATNFRQAADAYNQAFKESPSSGDYAMFQNALMEGYQGRYDSKIQMLRDMEQQFPSSALIPDALLEISESYIQKKEPAMAIDTYREVSQRFPASAQGRKASLQMAMLMYTTGDVNGASDEYKTLIAKYPSSEEAAQAVEEMKRISAANGTLTEFMAFLKNTSGAPQIDENQIENLAYENAEQVFLSSNDLTKLEDFVDDYPDSQLRPRALINLVEGEYNKGDNEAAYDYANALISQYPDNSYAREALVYKATIEEADGRIAAAFDSWKKLAQTASTPGMLLKARMGIMRTGRPLGELAAVLEAADAVLASSSVGADDLAEATFSKGWVLYKQGDIAEARKIWETIADQTDNLYGVQSAYYIAQSYYDAKDYKAAEQRAMSIAESDTPHIYWMARAFILLSDCYTATGDTFKGRQYLEAVRDNYSGDNEAEIRDMIDRRLK